MVTSCCAPGCTNRHEKSSGVGFYRFPNKVTEPERRAQWILATKRVDFEDKRKDWEPNDHRLCGRHFISGAPVNDKSHPDFVPSVFVFSPLRKSTPNKVSRFERLKRRCHVLETVTEENRQIQEKENIVRDEVVGALLDLSQGSPKFIDTGVNTEPDDRYDKLRQEYTQLQTEYQRLLDENRQLKETREKERFCYNNLDNSSISALTGLPNVQIFMWLLGLVGIFFKKIGNLCPGDQLLLVLMKLRLNLTNKDLAMRFRICPTQVSKILKQCLPVISRRLGFLIKWPEKNTILKNLPKVFKKTYKKCRVIIDCSELFIQRPSNLDARAKTYSNYKHHNTLKFLVGITPYGTVSFLSKCWGGRVSDKEITDKSGFYDKLEYGDLVLADRGFLIQEELAVRGASLAIPAFTKGKKQLPQKEVENSRRLSRARIHVERAIERIKNFQILKHTMPLTLVKHADDILIICAALTNLMPRLLK